MEPANAKPRVAPLLVAWTTLLRTSLIGILKTKFAPGGTEQCETHVVARRGTWQQRNETDLRSWKTDRRARWGEKALKGRKQKKERRGRSANRRCFHQLDARTEERCMIPLSGRPPASGVGHVFARVEISCCDRDAASDHRRTCLRSNSRSSCNWYSGRSARPMSRWRPVGRRRMSRGHWMRWAATI